MSIDTNAQVLLDDGEFFVQHNINYPATAGNGFLMLRRHASRAFQRQAAGRRDGR